MFHFVKLIFASLLGSLVLSGTSQGTQTILAVGARNVKTGYTVATGGGNGVQYSTTVAKGDGTTDDTAAFQAAIGSPSGNSNQTAVYVPPGTYLLSAGFTFARGHFFGEPSAPPTLVLKASSGLTGPFFYFTNPGNSTNNSFFFFVHDLNFTISTGNSGCTDAFLWDVAQDSSVRNVTIVRNDGAGNCFHQSGRNDGGGGGGSISNLTCTGGVNALVIDQTSQIPYRGCTFNGPVLWNGYWVASFIDCTFNNTGTTGFTGSGGDYVDFTNCTFTGTTGFTCSTPYHFENTRSAAQFSSANIYFNGSSEAGNSANLNSVIPATFPNPALPEPASTCINVLASGISANSSTDQGPAINALLATNNQLYFPPGNYTINSTVNLKAGQSIWGDCTGGGGFGTTLQGKANPILSVSGNGTASGVNIVRIAIQQTGSGNAVVWNGDPASSLFDVDIASSNGAGAPSLLVQSGGFFMDQSWPPAFNLGNTATWMQYNAQGPAYCVGVNPEHMSGPTVIISNGANLEMKSWEVENLQNVPAMPITSSSGINLSGMLQGGTPPSSNVFNVDTHSSVALFGIDMVGGSGGPQVGYNGSGYGPGSGIMQGFVTAQAAPTPTPGPTPTPTPTPTPSAIALVQNPASVYNPSASSLSLPFGAAQNKGDLNVVAINYSYPSQTVTSVSDSVNGSYTLAVTKTNSTQGGSSDVWYLPNIKAAAANANSVTVTFSGSPHGCDLSEAEFQGIAPGSPVDVTASNTGNGTAISSGAVATTNANDLVFTSMATSDGFSAVGTGYTLLNVVPTSANADEYKVVSTTGSQTGTMSSGSTGQWTCDMVTFKGATAVSTPTPTPSPTPVRTPPPVPYSSWETKLIQSIQSWLQSNPPTP